MDEARAWRALDADLFRFTSTDLRELHVALMTGFERASTLDPALNVDRVRQALSGVGWDEPLEPEMLQRALASLVGWGLLEVTQDHGAHYASPEEFERKNLQWSLTPRGEAAISGLLTALDALQHALGLQPAVLDAIGDVLAELAALLGAPRSAADDARTHVALAQLEGLLVALVGSVRQFNGHLQRLLRDDAVDDLVFSDVKHRTISYLQEYVAGVDRPQRRLRQGVERIQDLGPAVLFDRALTGANLAPVGNDDPAPAWIAERRRRWDSLCAWFAPADGAAPRIAGLLDVARTAIVELLRVLERRWDRRRRSASVAHDFRRLAGWFAEVPGDAEAHQLFGAAFGLWPARHAHLLAADEAHVVPTKTWLEAPGVDVAPSLRTTGDVTNRGLTRPVRDPRHTRAVRLREQIQLLAEHEAVRAALRTDGQVRLSSFGWLEPAVFDELLDLLGMALTAPVDGSGCRRALSQDGRAEVVLRDPGDGGHCALRTAGGVLRGPDLWVGIELLDEGSAVTDALVAVGGRGG